MRRLLTSFVLYGCCCEVELDVEVERWLHLSHESDLLLLAQLQHLFLWPAVLKPSTESQHGLPSSKDHGMRVARTTPCCSLGLAWWSGMETSATGKDGKLPVTLRSFQVSGLKLPR